MASHRHIDDHVTIVFLRQTPGGLRPTGNGDFLDLQFPFGSSACFGVEKHEAKQPGLFARLPLWRQFHDLDCHGLPHFATYTWSTSSTTTPGIFTPARASFLIL